MRNNNTNEDASQDSTTPMMVRRRKRPPCLPAMELTEAKRQYTTIFTGITVVVRAFCQPRWSSGRTNARLLGADRCNVHWGVFIMDPYDSNIFIEVFRGSCCDLLDVLSPGLERALARTLALIKFSASEASIVMDLVAHAVREVQAMPVHNIGSEP